MRWAWRPHSLIALWVHWIGNLIEFFSTHFLNQYFIIDFSLSMWQQCETMEVKKNIFHEHHWIDIIFMKNFRTFFLCCWHNFPSILARLYNQVKCWWCLKNFKHAAHFPGCFFEIFIIHEAIFCGNLWKFLWQKLDAMSGYYKKVES